MCRTLLKNNKILSNSQFDEKQCKQFFKLILIFFFYQIIDPIRDSFTFIISMCITYLDTHHHGSAVKTFTNDMRIYLKTMLVRCNRCEDDWFLPECTNSGTNRSCLSSYYIVTPSVMALQSSPAEQGAAVLLSSWITWPLNRILRIQLSMTVHARLLRVRSFSLFYIEKRVH